MTVEAPIAQPNAPAVLEADPVVGPSERSRFVRHALRLVAAIGTAGLLVATLTDALAVAGRHLGIPLIGSIEIVEAAIVLLACAALVMATAANGHAAVEVLTKRVGPRTRRRLAVISNLVSIGAALLLAAGSLMMLHDTWGGGEQSETLYIPLAPLRVFVIGAAIAVAAVFAMHLPRADNDG